MTPAHFYFLEGGFDTNILRFGSHSWIFGFTEFSVLEFSLINFTKFVVINFSWYVRILFSCVLYQLEFAMLVDFVLRLGSKLPCLFPFYFIFL